MKFQLLLPALLWVALGLFACQNQPPAPNPAVENPTPATAPAPVKADLYVGDFVGLEINEDKNPSYNNKITLAVESLENGVAKGFSVVAGNSRPFTGTYTEKGALVSIEAREPGDDQYDGTFKFEINRDSQSVKGTWTAFNTKLAVKKREFELKKREFKYDPNLELPEEVRYDALYKSYKPAKNEEEYGNGEFLTEAVNNINASKTLLKKEDVENMYRGDLEVIRNAIYARHGYSFKNRRMRYVFDYVDWYMPVSVNITQELTDIEKANIDLLKRYEQHAERYYDEYGR